MKKKMMAILLSVSCMLLLGACGTTKSETVTQTETSVDVKTEDAETEEVKTDDLESTEIEKTEEDEQKEEPIIWYMDAEGIKSDELGVMLRRENGITENISLSQSMGVIRPDNTSLQQFTCNYYDGDLDSYIAENPDFEKGMLGECEYAYHEYTSDTEVVFVGNGITLKTFVTRDEELSQRDSESLNDYLFSANVQVCDDFSKDCLIYFTDDDLYCPALGLAILFENGKNVIYGHYVSLSKNDNSQSQIFISDGREDGDAQELADGYVQKQMEYYADYYTEIEGTVETTVGRYKYLGRGIEQSNNGYEDTENWVFYSDDTKWIVYLYCTAEEGRDLYLSMLETMQ